MGWPSFGLQREVLDVLLARREPLVAELLRHTLDAEVGMVNQGALRPVALRDTVRLAAIDTLVRFDDHLVRIRLRGSKLRALAQEAEILLLDEPLTGLDTPSQEAIFTTLDTLKAHGITVLMATHDLDQASERFDRMMLLNRRLVAFGAPGEVLTPSNLLMAYGGHLHLLPGGGAQEQLVLTDTCCEGGEP